MPAWSMSPKRTLRWARNGTARDANRWPPLEPDPCRAPRRTRRATTMERVSRSDRHRRGRIAPVTPLRRRRRGNRGRALGLLGLAAVGVGVVLMARREAGRDGAPRARRDREPGPPPPETDPSVEPQGRWVDGPAGRLFVHTAGAAGTPVLLLHGLAGRGEHWDAPLAALGGRCRVAAPDLRAHGRSDPPRDGDYSLAGYVADALAVADALGSDRFVLAGHSLGA